jgi:hypothetical protein
MRKVLYLREDEIGGVIHVSEWSMRGIIDERYGEGRIFLAGDACKMHLGSVDVHRVLITDAASETNAVKLSSVLQ